MTEQAELEDWEKEYEEIEKKTAVQVPTPTPIIEPIVKPELPEVKETFQSRMAAYKSMSPQHFQSLFTNISKSSSNKQLKNDFTIMKNEKDFTQFAQSVGKKLAEQAEKNVDGVLDEECLRVLFQELVLYLYNEFEWKNLHEVQSFLKILKKERKGEQEKMRKQREKEERLKKTVKVEQEELAAKQKKEGKERKEHKGPQQIFGGAQEAKVQQDPKKKQIKKIVQNDDDDFM